jgi:hypothetical protein
VNLEALADFLASRGLLLRSARLIGKDTDIVAEFTCEPAPSAPAARAVSASPPPAAPADDPDGLELYLEKKGQRP